MKGRIEASQRREEQLRLRAVKLEEEIRNDRLQIYNAVLEPFILLFSKEKPLPTKGSGRPQSNEERATTLILSTAYKQSCFRLMLFANDGVTRAYNRLMYLFYHPEDNTPSQEGSLDPRTRSVMVAFSEFLLEIRKSIGNEGTLLSSLEMITWMITDSEKLTDSNSIPMT